MGPHDQIADPPALSEPWRERHGKQTNLEPPLAAVSKIDRSKIDRSKIDRDEATGAGGPLLTALLRALSAWTA